MFAFYQNRTLALRITEGENLTFRPHLHRQVEIIYLWDGEMEVNIDLIPRTLHAGELCIVFPNVIHSYDTPNYSKHSMIIFNMELTAEYMDFLTNYHCLDPYLPPDQIDEDIPYCIRSMIRSGDDSCTKNTLLMRGFLYVILARILPIMKLEKICRSQDADVTHQALFYATQNFREPITLEQVAKEIGVSRFYLSHTFSEKVGVGFTQYINTLRIGVAQHMLLLANNSITKVAYDCGFSSQRTFNRVFRQYCGMTPKEYRQQKVRTDDVFLPDEKEFERVVSQQ